MLQTKPLQDLLSQALSSDVQIALLATRQGTLIAHALNLSSNSSSSSIEARRRQARSLAAISNVIWKNYANIKNIDELWDSHNGETNGQPTVEPKQSLLWTAVDCEDGKILLYQVPLLSDKGLLLVLSGTKDAPIGMMHAKAELLAQYLEKPLSELETI